METWGIVILGILLILLASQFLPGDIGIVEQLENEWVMFGVVFLILFASIYYFVNKKTDNAPTSAIVGGGLALLMTIPIMKRGLLEDFLSESIVDWIIIIAVIVAVFFAVYWFYKKFNWKGVLLILILLALVPTFIDLANILPSDIYYGPVGDFIEVLKGISNIILIAAVGWIIIMIVMKLKSRGRNRGSNTNQIPQQNRQPQQSPQQTSQFGATRARRLIELNRRYKYFINRNKNLNTPKAQTQVRKYQAKIAKLQRKARKIGITLN